MFIRRELAEEPYRMFISVYILCPLFIVWSFETIHRLKFYMQRQKRHDITNDVNVNFLICGFVGCVENMLFLADMLFLLSLARVQWNSQKSGH